MQNAEIREYADFLAKLADAAAEITLPRFKMPIETLNKGPKLHSHYDPVTEADKKAETAIRELIKASYPDHNILGEEHGPEQNNPEQNNSEGNNRNRQYSWVIDPIDGTRAYICGIPTWGTLIALNEDGRAVMGIMDQPYLKERYLGGPQGTFLNGKKISCRPCSLLSKAVISTTDPTQFFATHDDQAAFQRVAEKARLVRNGYDCYAYAMVAAGFMDVVIESGLEAYDIQALIPIIEGAGGIVSNWTGGTASEGGQVVASATDALHQQVLALLNP